MKMQAFYADHNYASAVRVANTREVCFMASIKGQPLGLEPQKWLPTTEGVAVKDDLKLTLIGGWKISDEHRNEEMSRKSISCQSAKMCQ